SSSLDQLIYRHKNRLEMLCTKFLHNKINLEEYNVLLNDLSKRLNDGLTRVLTAKEQQLFNQARHLELVNPKNVLSRGYAIVKNRKNQVVYSSKDLKQHERLNIVLRDDEVNVIVDKKAWQDELI
ncbi:MAG TPA: exodeoxyribonuclease VII large subunit, partial [Aquella sp.]|nr:exodeoxyribonuclease VII large subunit [Aquella sp.]